MTSLYQVLAAAALVCVSAGAVAGPMCTDAPRAQWQSMADFHQKLEKQGYKIDAIEVSDGGCYEIEGTNPSGQRVEIHFNPVDGKAVRTEVKR